MQIVYVARDDLKQKYQHQKVRTQSMCKAIGEFTQTTITSQVSPNGTIRFVIVGPRIKRGIKYILDEFCKVC